MTEDKALYVEYSFDEVETFFYCEALTVRSAKHDWKIKPHRHKDLYQVFIVTEGGVNVRLDDRYEQLTAPCVIFIPDDVIHGFDWIVGSKGYVLSIASSVIKQIAQNIGGMQFLSESLMTNISSDVARTVIKNCQELEGEDQARHSLRESMLIALLHQLLIRIFRIKPVVKEINALSLTKSERKVAQFKRLIKEHAIEHHQVAWFANRIGVSSAHLNVICQQYTDSSALGLIHKQLLDEAKRLLIFADIRITAIADRLGFYEQTYFTKFFKKLTGHTPSNYRKNYR